MREKRGEKNDEFIQKFRRRRKNLSIVSDRMNLKSGIRCVDIFWKTNCAQKKHHIESYYIMFALSCNNNARSFCIAASSKRTSSFNGRRRHARVNLFVSKSKSGEDFVDSAETKKSSSSLSSSSIQNTFSSPKASSLVKAFSISTSFLLFQADNAFAASADTEELKQFLIGFWNFRTGDVTSILLYTVAPIALPYLIFSQVI